MGAIWVRESRRMVENHLGQIEDGGQCPHSKRLNPSKSAVDCPISLMTSSALCGCLYSYMRGKNFLKFWWNEELTLLKEASIESDKSWKAAGKPRTDTIFDRRQACRRKYRRGEKCNTESYINDLHEALLQKNNTDCWKCWRSKFESSNKCNQVEGCVDPDVICTHKFCNLSLIHI